VHGKSHYCKHNASCRGSRRLKAEGTQKRPLSAFPLKGRLPLPVTQKDIWAGLKHGLAWR